MEEDATKLKEWLERNGVDVNSFPFSLSSFGGAGRGFIASRDIAADEVLVAIPSQLLLAPTSIQRSTFSHILRNPSTSSLFSSLKDNVALCLVLACERFLATDSFWSPYFPALPTEYTISANFTEKELKMLQNEKVQNQKEILLAAYESVLPLLKEIGTITQEQFTWAWGVVQTRACYKTGESSSFSSISSSSSSSSSHSLLLVPWGDFLNHSSFVDTVASFENDEYKIITKTPFKKGEQVFISYGKHTNSVLLHYYGFAIDGNPDDIVSIDIEHTPFIQHQLKLQSATSSKHKILSHSDKGSKQLWAQKEKILAENGLSIYGKFTAQMGESPISWNLITVLRIIHANAQEIANSTYMNVFNDEIISVKNEVDVCNFLVSLSETLLKNYNTSLDEDTALLESGTLSFVESCIVITRKMEKNILIHLIQYCKDKLGTLT